MSIKNDVFKWSKKIAEKQDLDIEAEELASMALYKIYNQPYFQGQNDFIRLHKNIFNEISLGLCNLNNLGGSEHTTINQLNINFSKPRSKDYEINTVNENKILKTDQEIKELNLFLNMLKNTNSFSHLIKEIEDYESKEDTLFYSKIIISSNETTHNKNTLVSALDYFLDYKEKDTEKEYALEFKTKKDLYRSNKISSLEDRLYEDYKTKELMKGNKPIEEMEDFTFKRLTGLNNMTLEDIKNFKKTHPEMYEKSLYKSYLDIKDPDLRMKTLYNDIFFKDDKQVLINKIENILKEDGVEYTLKQYQKEIDLILKETIKKYPEIGYSSIHEGKKDIIIKSYDGSNEYYLMQDNHTKDNKLELFHQDYGISRYYDAIKGLHVYNKKYHYKVTFAALKNDLEEFAVIESFVKDSLRIDGEYLNMKSLYLCSLQDAGRGINEDDLFNLYSSLINNINDDKFIISYDLYDRKNMKENNKDILHYNVIQRLKKEYPTFIFYNDGMKINIDNYAMASLKKDMLTYAVENNMSKEDIINVDKKIEEFIKSDNFNDIEKLEYKERELLIQKLLKDFSKKEENHYKNKVKI